MILTNQYWEDIVANELFAYLYDTNIIAVEPNFPTAQETEISRRRVLYNTEAYLAYLAKNSEDEIQLGDPARDIRCASIRPGTNFIGYVSNDHYEEIEAQNVVTVRNH